MSYAITKSECKWLHKFTCVIKNLFVTHTLLGKWLVLLLITFYFLYEELNLLEESHWTKYKDTIFFSVYVIISAEIFLPNSVNAKPVIVLLITYPFQYTRAYEQFKYFLFIIRYHGTFIYIYLNWNNIQIYHQIFKLRSILSILKIFQCIHFFLDWDFLSSLFKCEISYSYIRYPF